MEKVISESISSDSFHTKWFDLSDTQAKEIGHYLKNYLLNGTPVEKLRSLKILRSLSEYSPSILRYISRRIIKYIFDWALYKGSTTSPDRGSDLFDSTDPVHQKASADFLAYFLESIIFWGKISPPESNLRTAHEKIIESKVVLFPVSVTKEEIIEKLHDVQMEIDKIRLGRSKQDSSLIEGEIKNLGFYLRSIRVLCDESERLIYVFKEQIMYFEKVLQVTLERLEEFGGNCFGGADGDIRPKILPRPDSPVDYEMVTIEEDSVFDEGQKEWNSIKDEFYRLKEAEVFNKCKISQLQENILIKVHQLADLHLELKDHKEEIDSIKKKLKKLLFEFQSYKSQTDIEIEEKNTLIAVMVNNKAQMREVFLAKEKENSDLCQKIEDLQNELSQYNSLDTTRLSMNDLRFSRAEIQLENLDEPNNLKYFGALLCTSQGILFKNRSIEVGICIKVDKPHAQALIYIGNCMDRPIEYLETVLISPELPGEISETVEKQTIAPLSQSNRKLTFTFERFFKIPPKLLVHYNSSYKLLQLPITSAMFLTPCAEPVVGMWEVSQESPSYVFVSQMPFSKLQKMLQFYPSVKFCLVEPEVFLCWSEVIVKLQQKLEQVEIEVRCKSSELLTIISELCKEQLNLSESLYI